MDTSRRDTPSWAPTHDSRATDMRRAPAVSPGNPLPDNVVPVAGPGRSVTVTNKAVRAPRRRCRAGEAWGDGCAPARARVQRYRSNAATISRPGRAACGSHLHLAEVLSAPSGAAVGSSQTALDARKRNVGARSAHRSKVLHDGGRIRRASSHITNIHPWQHVKNHTC